LKVEHYDSIELAFEDADALVDSQRAEIATIQEQHPDKIFPNHPKLDQFWYVDYHQETIMTQKWIQQYKMNAKLNDKNQKMIADTGIKSDLLGMRTPHCVDMLAVKKENGVISELEKEIANLK
jgi:hypothetical protein